MRSPWLALVLLASVATGLALLSVAVVGGPSPPVYSRILHVHGVAGIAWYCQAFAFLLPGRPGTDRRRLALASMFVTASIALARWPLAGATLLLLAVLGLLVGVLDIRSASGPWFLLSAMGQATVPISILFPQLDRVAGLVPTLVPTLIVATLVRSVDPQARIADLAAALTGGTYLFVECRAFFIGMPPPRALEFAAAACLCAVVSWSSARADRWQRVSRCVAAALLLESAFLLFVQRAPGSSVYLLDTLFVVGRAHLEAFVLLVAVVGTLGRPAHSRTAWVGLALLSAGSHALGWMFVFEGQRGMPRSYVHHPEAFLPLERAALVAALLLASGLVLVALAELGGPGAEE
ncbi:MAG: hypothetical protein JNL79_21140 [Myxococcales bacterium]|nr:hypothetical protein [Myxococcales bacterium]